MRPYSRRNEYVLYHGNMLDMDDVVQSNSIDSIVTDPPYELGFMGKSWDNSGIAFRKETWEKCLKVLKPGGYLLAFGGSRTFHRIACAIEDAGFEIRDTVMWLYGSGFPKSASIGKMIESKLINGSGNVKDIKKLDGVTVSVGGGWVENEVETGKRSVCYEQTKTIVNYKTDEGRKWEGWGTALKPSYEPIIIARKPCDGSCVANVLKWGVGGINIDECRVGTEERTYKGMSANIPEGAGCFRDDEWKPKDIEKTVNGRFPANTILTYDETDFEEVCGGLPNGGKNGSISKRYKMNNRVYGEYGECNTWQAYDDSGSAARYFYCAKASKRDRDEGLENMEVKSRGMSNQALSELKRGNDDFDGGSASTIGLNRVVKRRNVHPTVKPTELMQYLVRLVTPDGGTILDPFNGSGSTGKAVMWENRDRNKGYKYIGVEMNEEYLEISKARIDYVIGGVVKEQEEEIKEGQISIFDLLEGEQK